MYRRDKTGLGWAVAAIAAAALLGLYLLDVFTWHGLVYTFGLGGPAGLLWPAGTRTVTLLLALTLAAAVSGALDWRDARLAHRSRLHALLLGYATCWLRAYRRATWAGNLVHDAVAQLVKPTGQARRATASQTALSRAGEATIIDAAAPTVIHDDLTPAENAPVRRDGAA